MIRHKHNMTITTMRRHQGISVDLVFSFPLRYEDKHDKHLMINTCNSVPFPLRTIIFVQVIRHKDSGLRFFTSFVLMIIYALMIFLSIKSWESFVAELTLMLWGMNPCVLS